MNSVPMVNDDAIDYATLAREPLLFLDLETSGANLAHDRIIEVGLIEVDSNGAREWSTLVNPEISISPFITSLTGIDTGMVVSAPTFAEIASTLMEKITGRLFIAHNARFDYGFLKHEFKRLGVDYRALNLCTVKLSRKLFPEHHRHSLDALITRYQLDVGDRHRALSDARLLWQLWQRWHALLPADSVRATVENIVARPKLPPQLDVTLIDDLPEAAGAYALLDEQERPLVVKRCTNLYKQILSHFTEAKQDSAVARNTCRVEWRTAAGELGAHLQEIALGKLGGRQENTDTLCTWQLLEQARGDFRPSLVFATETNFASHDALFGLYPGKREAQHGLRRLAEGHHLCFSILGIGENQPGKPCIAYKQKTCRGTCVGKEAIPLHSARLMTALAKLKVRPWPFKEAVAIVERDHFGMYEDYHIVNGWRHMATVHNEDAVHSALEGCCDHSDLPFDPETYRILNRFLQTGKLKVIELPT